jgi:hypothetical protein
MHADRVLALQLAGRKKVKPTTLPVVLILCPAIQLLVSDLVGK